MFRLCVGILLLCCFCEIVAAKTVLASKILSSQSCGYKEYSATCGEVQVPENHLHPSEHSIVLPFQLIRGNLADDSPRKVVMALGGGPGMSNMDFAPSEEVLAVSDVLLVGFRGVDGSANMSCPEVDDAFTGEKRLFAPRSQLKIRDAFSSCLTRLGQQGIDVQQYNPQQTVEDMETVRGLLGIDKVSILAGSFGTRLAQYYAMQHPQSLERMVLVAANPPGRTVWEPELVSSIMRSYGIDNAAAVLERLPESWMGIDLDPARIGISTFALLFSTDSAGMAIAAYKEAAEGDYAGLAMLSLSHDMLVAGKMNWGHLMMMAASVDYDDHRDYDNDLKASSSSFGSPMARFLWTMIQQDKVKLLPEAFRSLKPISTPVLVIGGSLDISTPAVFAEQELMPYLENGTVLRVGNAGHYDLWKRPVRDVISAYLADQVITTSLDLAEPDYEAGFFTLSRIAKFAPVALLLALTFLLLVIQFIVRKVRKP